MEYLEGLGPRQFVGALPVVDFTRVRDWLRAEAIGTEDYVRTHTDLASMEGANEAQAADLLRRFSAFTGLAAVDDLLDEVRATSVIKALLSRLGIV